MLDPLVVEWHDGGLTGMSMRGETLDPLVAEWHDGGFSKMTLRGLRWNPRGLRG